MDPRIRIAAAGAIALLVLVVAIAFVRSDLTPISVAPSPTSSPTVAGAQSTATTASALPTPIPTPEGTPGPTPSTALGTGASASIAPPPAPPTPTPGPQAGLWRVQGYVVDENGNPLSGVCVVVGPHGCQRWSPHTDDRGHYFLDVAESKADVQTAFDFYFQLPGRETIWWHFIPEGPIEFNVVLKKA